MQFDDTPFSEREKDVLHLLLQGKGNKQIALELGIASRTVEFHLSNIYSKLGVNTRAEAILKLAEGQLRDSTGEVPRKATVDQDSDSTDNGFQPTSWRIAMKRLFASLGLLSAVLLLTWILVRAQAVPGVESVLTAGPETPTHEVAFTPTVTTPALTDENLPLPVAVQPTPIAIAPHTVNGYTAEIVSYYADTSHILFQVRVTSDGKTIWKDYVLGYPNLYDEYGRLLNASAGYRPAVDPSLTQFGFVPAPLLAADRVKGQFTFRVESPTNGNEVFAQFSFDFEIPIVEATRFQPKQTVSANGLEILLDSATTRPGFTQVYICFRPPSRAPWTVGSNTTLRMGDQEVPLYTSGELFDSFTGSYWGIQSEPYWIPPTKTESCYKLGFEIGSPGPASFTLTIPDLVNLLVEEDPNVFLPDVIATNYPGLNAREAYHTYLEEKGNTLKGPWIFEVTVTP